MVDRILEFYSEPARHRRILAVVVFLIFASLGTNILDSLVVRSIFVRDDHTFGVKASASHRCYDTDDPAKFRQRGSCFCSDPLTPTKWNKPGWQEHHEELVQFARQAINAPNGKIDLVMIGDSIIERWNGTRSMGQQLADEFLPVFEQYFIKHGGSDLEAIALGSSGDTSNNLLWHLSNGILDIKELQPSVWFIMVGTNDLGRTGCSKRNTLAGILHIAQYLRDQRPGATIIIHGLLPRSDSREAVPQLGRMWEQILFINRELRKLCNLHEEWVYMEAAKLFLRRAEGETRKIEINTDTMPDGLHPSVEGYELWGQEILRVVHKVQKR